MPNKKIGLRSILARFFQYLRESIEVRVIVLIFNSINFNSHRLNYIVNRIL